MAIEEATPILFMFVVLLFGIFITKIADDFSNTIGSIPYTVIMFVIGIVMALSLKEHDLWGTSVQKWAYLEPNVLLFVFLPPLLAGEAMFLNWFHWLGSFWDSLLLAGPGVLLGAFAVGGLTQIMLPYGWSFYLSMTLGSVLATTDTAAVVAILNEVNGSPKLTMMLVGESMLNDGTSMVLFNLFFSLVSGSTYTWYQIIGFLANACVGSVAFGCACGLSQVYLLRSYRRRFRHEDSTMQICITICWAYLVFFLAQNVFGQSGVLACVSSSLMIAWLAPPIILNPEAMHHVWNLLVWFCNTLLFLLAGLKLGTIDYSILTSADWGYMLALYGILMVVRAIVLAVFFPVLSRVGYRVTAKEMIFVAWSGLRGALSIALALSVIPIDNQVTLDDSTRLFFYAGGVTGLTLLINATTAKPLLKKLGLVGSKSLAMSTAEMFVKRGLRKKLVKTVFELVEQHDLNKRETDFIRHFCKVLRTEDLAFSWIEDSPKSISRHSLVVDSVPDKPKENNTVVEPLQSINEKNIALLLDTSISIFSAADGTDLPPSSDQKEEHIDYEDHPFSTDKNEDRIDITNQLEFTFLNRANLSFKDLVSENGEQSFFASYHRAVLLEIVRARYWKNIRDGKLSRSSFAARCLLFSVEVALDDTEAPLADWLCVRQLLDRHPWYVRLIYQVGRMFRSVIVLRWLTQYEADFEKRVTYTVSAFIDAHEYAQRKLHEYAHLASAEDIDNPNDNIYIGESTVKSESEAEVQVAREMVNEVPERVIRLHHLKQITGIILAREAQIVEDWTNEGVMSELLASEVFEDIENDSHRLDRDTKKTMRALRVERRKGSLHSLDSASKDLNLEEAYMHFSVDGNGHRFDVRSKNSINSIHSPIANSDVKNGMLLAAGNGVSRHDDDLGLDLSHAGADYGDRDGNPYQDSVVSGLKEI